MSDLKLHATMLAERTARILACLDKFARGGDENEIALAVQLAPETARVLKSLQMILPKSE